MCEGLLRGDCGMMRWGGGEEDIIHFCHLCGEVGRGGVEKKSEKAGDGGRVVKILGSPMRI